MYAPKCYVTCVHTILWHDVIHGTTATSYDRDKYIEHVHGHVSCPNNYVWQNDRLSGFGILYGLCILGRSCLRWPLLCGVSAYCPFFFICDLQITNRPVPLVTSKYHSWTWRFVTFSVISAINVCKENDILVAEPSPSLQNFSSTTKL